jgi:antirestriction protein
MSLLTLAMKPSPRIYVACLAAYNNGKLYGEWIDADQDADQILEEIQTMLESSPEPDAEEWAIHDYEDFCEITLGESESIERVADLAQMIAKHGPAYALYVSEKGIEHATEEGFLEDYCGEYDSEEDYAEEYFSDTNEIPDYLQMYINWKSVAYDLFIRDFFSAKYNGSLYVFRRS